MIVKLSPHKWQVQSEKGKNLGTYKTEKEAKRRLQQVEYFKHKNHSEDQKYFVSLKNFNDITFAHVKGPVYGFDEAKEALLNLIMANKQDFAEGTIRLWQGENILYRIRSFNEKSVANKVMVKVKKIDEDLYDSLIDSKDFTMKLADNGPKQIVKTIKDPKNYKKYLSEAGNKIKTNIKNSPKYFKNNPDKILPTTIATAGTSPLLISPATRKIGLAMSVVPTFGATRIGLYTATDYTQRKAKRVAKLIKDTIKN